MTRIRTILADDEPLALTRLKALCSEIPDVEIVGTASNGKEASEAATALQPDLMILDIQMPKANGLRVASAFNADNGPEIVFVTAFEHYAPDAFAVEAADYLLKPVRFDRLWQAIERVKRRHYLRSLSLAAGGKEAEHSEARKAQDGLWVQSRNEAEFVSIDAIEWVEAQRDYVILHTATHSHIVRMSMRTFEEKFGDSALMRVHRSAFARPSTVVEVRKTGKTITALILRDGVVVPVGPNYSRLVAQRLGWGTGD